SHDRDAPVLNGTDIRPDLEFRQERNGCVSHARKLCQGQCVHVVERRRDKITVAFQILAAQAGLRYPKMAFMRKYDALWNATGAPRVEKHRGRAWLNIQCVEIAGPDKCGETIAAVISENYQRQTGRADFPALLIAKNEIYASISKYEADHIS